MNTSNQERPMQKTLQSLMKQLPHPEADELATLLAMWPQQDDELKKLLEESLGELLHQFALH
ncbi:MAG: hypothetical protein VKJ64_10215 [Leptolyngbyaceae bacterium]|nr:hypothetical protein [Leptolyngbyaceae bacterium]